MDYGYTPKGATPPIIEAPSQQQFSEIIAKAIEVATKAGNKASSSNIGQQVKNGLITYSKDIQDTVDYFLQNQGVVTQEQLNQLDEKTKQAKLKLLEAESQNTFVRYGLYVAAGIFGFGILWFLTRDKSQKNG
jgi:hypothetical protein